MLLLHLTDIVDIADPDQTEKVLGCRITRVVFAQVLINCSVATESSKIAAPGDNALLGLQTVYPVRQITSSPAKGGTGGLAFGSPR